MRPTAIAHLARRAAVIAAPIAAASVALLIAGCGVLPRNAVPPEYSGQAVVRGLPDVRAAAGRLDAAMMDDLVQSFAQEDPAQFPPQPKGGVRYAHLAVSGGGANGAFGAGVLSGWSDSGKRPVFKIVTGVSTGALIAPFAFLGSESDADLRRFYTTTASRNIFERRSLLPQLLSGEALADTLPLARLIAQTIDEPLLERVAAAHRAGRRLYVGTTNLDAQVFQIWNMGRIAASGHPDALKLFRKVLLASASIPVAFPPVFFNVEVAGQSFDEMHVDGGVGANMFFTGGVINLVEARERAGRTAGIEELYVIHNGQFSPTPQTTQRSLRAIALRVFESAGKSAVIGNLFRIYAIAERSGVDMLWITIPPELNLRGEELFDPTTMTMLYEAGVAAGSTGTGWNTGLPRGLEPRTFAP